MIASQLMSTRIQVCRATESLHDAAERMWNADIGCLPVVDETGHVAGMLTDRDICMAAYTQAKPLHAITVGAVMSRNVVSCLSKDTLAQVEYAMRTHRVRRLPVINERGKLLGVIAMNDLIREAARETPRVSAGVSAGGLVSALATISEPRRPLLAETAAE